NTTPDSMGELAEADGGGVAVAADTEIDQVLGGDVGAGEHGRHAAVDGVEAVCRTDEIIRCLRRAADAREFRKPVRGEIDLEARLDDRRADGVMAAAGAEGGNTPFIVTAREPKRVLFERRVMQRRFCDVG